MTAEQVWVEIEWTALEPNERRPDLPADTAATPLLVRTRGNCVAPVLGENGTITTVTGRTLTGVVRELRPGYTHGFGHPLPAWLAMRDAIRAEAGPLRVSARRDPR